MSTFICVCCGTRCEHDAVGDSVTLQCEQCGVDMDLHCDTDYGVRLASLPANVSTELASCLWGKSVLKVGCTCKAMDEWNIVGQQMFTSYAKNLLAHYLRITEEVLLLQCFYHMKNIWKWPHLHD